MAAGTANSTINKCLWYYHHGTATATVHQLFHLMNVMYTVETMPYGLYYYYYYYYYLLLLSSNLLVKPFGEFI